MGWLQVARITKDFVNHSGPHPIKPGEKINVFAGSGGASSVAYMESIERNFKRAPGVNPNTPLSDAYGMLIDDDPAAATAAMAKLTPDQRAAMSAYDSSAAVEEDSTIPPASAAEVPGDCSSIPNQPSYTSTSDLSIQLSPNFTYGQLSWYAKAGSHKITGPKRGLSAYQQMCNLQSLALNVLEPLAATYGRGNVQINSGYRNSGSATSQHEIGQAVDIRFVNLPTGRASTAQKAYFDRAKEIRDSLVYDQLLLEVFGNAGPWIHVSYKPNQCRRDVRTFFSHTSNKPGLILVG